MHEVQGWALPEDQRWWQAQERPLLQGLRSGQAAGLRWHRAPRWSQVPA